MSFDKHNSTTANAIILTILLLIQVYFYSLTGAFKYTAVWTCLCAPLLSPDSVFQDPNKVAM